jgi:hypothetical protein
MIAAPIQEKVVEYIIGAGLGIVIPIFGAMVGLDRDRAFYPTALIVIASYYLLFAAIGGSVQTAVVEVIGMSVFIVVAVVGFKFSPWWIVLGLFSHGLFDFTHGLFIDNTGVPLWWPGFCLSIDVVLSIVLGLLLVRGAGRAGARQAA